MIHSLFLQMISEFEASKRRLQNMEDEFKKFNDKREEDRKEFESALFLKSKEVDEFRSEMRQLQSEKVSMSDTVIELKTLLRFVKVDWFLFYCFQN